MNEPVTSWPVPGSKWMSSQQQLADALRDAAADLPFEQQRVHHRADIVDDVVAQELDLAGLGVDLEFADMHAVREILLPGGVGGARRRGRAPCRRAGSSGPTPRRRCRRNGTVRSVPAIEKTPSAKSMSASAASSRCAAIAFAFSTIRSVAISTAEPPKRRRARAAGALADRDLVGVALDVGAPDPDGCRAGRTPAACRRSRAPCPA